MIRFVAPAVLVLATFFETFTYEVDGAWLAFGILLLAALFVQHRWPATALGLATLGAFGHLAILGNPLRPLDFAVPITVYTLASKVRRRWVTLAGLGTVLVITVVAVFMMQGQPQPPLTMAIETDFLPTFAGMFPPMAALVAAFALGEATRTRRAHLLTLEQRAADMQRERAQREALAAASERGRLSREMHDVVAHGLSVIVMQAQGGAAVLRERPDRTAEALEHIIVTGRAAMADMRSLLGLAQSGPRLAPQPGVAALPALVDRIRDAGTPVALHIDGQLPPLPTAVDLSAYRIVQEALTNVIKHAGSGALATVHLGFPPGQLELEITDDGAGSGPDPEAGHGLRGMTERVAALGGQMSSGPRDSGGFRVWVRLPVQRQP